MRSFFTAEPLSTRIGPELKRVYPIRRTIVVAGASGEPRLARVKPEPSRARCRTARPSGSCSGSRKPPASSSAAIRASIAGCVLKRLESASTPGRSESTRSVGLSTQRCAVDASAYLTVRRVALQPAERQGHRLRVVQDLGRARVREELASAGEAQAQEQRGVRSEDESRRARRTRTSTPPPRLRPP